MLKPVYALVGEDSFLQLQKIKELVAAGGDVTRIDLDGESAELGDVLDELRSFAMFGGGKLLVMRNGDEFVKKYREQLEDYLAKPANNSTLVLRMSSLPATQRIYKLITKVGVVEKAEPPSERELPRWITNRAKETHQAAVDGDAAVLLAELIGADLGRLDGELSRLALQSEKGRIGKGLVLESVAFQRDQEIKEMTAEAASGRTQQAVERWRRLVHADSSAEFRAVTWLSMWLEDASNYFVAPAAFAKNSYRYRGELMAEFKRNVEALGKSGVRRLVDLLAEVDLQSKTGVGNMMENVERFLLMAAPAKQGAATRR